jgi:hypothetical protein
MRDGARARVQSSTRARSASSDAITVSSTERDSPEITFNVGTDRTDNDGGHSDDVVVVEDAFARSLGPHLSTSQARIHAGPTPVIRSGGAGRYFMSEAENRAAVASSRPGMRCYRHVHTHAAHNSWSSNDIDCTHVARESVTLRGVSGWMFMCHLSLRSFVLCRCRGLGHTAMVCPEVDAGGSFGPTCYVCAAVGHTSRDCGDAEVCCVCDGGCNRGNCCTLGQAPAWTRHAARAKTATVCLANWLSIEIQPKSVEGTVVCRRSCVCVQSRMFSAGVYAARLSTLWRCPCASECCRCRRFM